MKRQVYLACLLIGSLWALPARADTGVIVRTANLPALQALCLLPTTCTVVRPLDGALGQIFLVTTPLPLQSLLGLLNNVSGFVDAELDQLISLADTVNLVPSPISPTLLSDRTPVPYPAGSATMAWNSYATQPAAGVVEIQNAQSQFNVTGTGIVADIDTGVDPNHPALQGVLLPGYDFTRNQAGGSEMTDLASTFPQPTPCDSTTCPAAVQVNQSSAAILDQSSAAILDTNTQYSAFGHGTMVMGVIHLVAPTAQLLPLKAFKSDGTANLSDILRAIYYAAQNNANVINMSFDTKTASTELKNALDYANQLGVVSVASAGNDGVQETVYPAALQNDVMGVASVGSTTTTDNTRSSFSNFGTAIVWLAAPGEQIITTYPFNSYAAGWGTSFSAPFVSGGAALLRGLSTALTQSQAAAAFANAAPLTDSSLGHGRLDLVPALQSVSGGSGSADFNVAAAPPSATTPAGQSANYTVSVSPAHGFNQTVMWSCSGAPAGATCTVSPSSATLDGTHTATATVTLATTARAMAPPLALPPATPTVHTPVMFVVCLAWIVASWILYQLIVSVRLRRSFVAFAGLFVVCLLAYSCGGYSSGGGPPGSLNLSSVTLTPTSVSGGSSSTGTATLSGPSPPYGVAVDLASSSSAATVPASVPVASGASSATFTVSTTAVTASTSVTITASYGGSSKTAMLTVTPTTTGTPAGTYTLTVTGTSGNLTHSTTLQATVN